MSVMDRQAQDVRVPEDNKSVIIEIFEAIKRITGKTFKDLKVQPITIQRNDQKILEAQRLLVLLFVQNRLSPFILCYYLNCTPQRVDEIYHAAYHDLLSQHDLELANAMICGEKFRTLTPREGVLNFQGNANQWLGRRLKVSQVSDLMAYVEGPLTGVNRAHDKLAAIRGLQLIACDPPIRRLLAHYLMLSGLCQYVGLLDYQIRELH
jgi:hypothetical protein